MALRTINSQLEIKTGEEVKTANEWANDLENAVRRGDEFFDLYEQERKLLSHSQGQYDEIADRLRSRDEVIAKLHALLKKNNISSEIEDD